MAKIVRPEPLRNKNTKFEIHFLSNLHRSKIRAIGEAPGDDIIAIFVSAILQSKRGT
jgi:hypothetical protein